MNEKRTFIWWAVAAVIAMMAIAFLTSCRSTTKIEKEYIHTTDTIIESKFIHDTTEKVVVKLDSVDRYVRDSSWVDSLGRIHNDRLERIREKSNYNENMYKSLLEDYTKLKESKSDDVQIKEVEKIVEKKVYMWWPGVVVFLFLVAVCIGGGCLVAKILTKYEEAEDNERN